MKIIIKCIESNIDVCCFLSVAVRHHGKNKLNEKNLISAILQLPCQVDTSE